MVGKNGSPPAQSMMKTHFLSFYDSIPFQSHPNPNLPESFKTLIHDNFQYLNFEPSEQIEFINQIPTPELDKIINSFEIKSGMEKIFQILKDD